jgi:Saxitoxin biosynthesis operon protein SxtJ
MATHEDLSRAHDVKSSSNRAFGWVFVVVFVAIGLWPLFFGGGLRWWSLYTAGVITLVTLLAPALLALPNRLWLRFGLLLNRLISPVVLAFMFYVVVTPIGVLMRFFAKDNLHLRGDGAADRSYWIRRDPPGPKPDSLTNQF